MADLRPLNLKQYESFAVLPLEVRGPGTYQRYCEMVGNSILSTIFIKAIDPGATLLVKYWDVTTGSTSNERYDLKEHALITDSITLPFNDRIIVTRIHNRVVVEATVTGGTIDFSVYTTVVTDFASDLDSALVLNASDFVQSINKAMPVACLDELTGKLFFLKCKEGALSVSEVGDEFFAEVQTVTDPGVEKILLSFTVPVGFKRKLKSVYGSCSVGGIFKVKHGSVIIGSGRINPATSNFELKFDPGRSIPAGDSVSVTYKARSGLGVVDVEAYLMALDIEV